MSYICMVVDGPYPQDIRVRKEAESLAKVGEKVVVVCPYQYGLERNEVVNGVAIARIGSHYSFRKRGIQDILNGIFNKHFYFYKGFQQVLKAYDIDWLHVHDLPLAHTFLKFRSEVKYGLILDLHENYPEALKVWFKWRRNPLIKLKNALFFNPKMWAKREKSACEAFDRVICVVDEMKERLVKTYEIPQEKFVVVSNMESINFVKDFEKGRKSHKTKDFVISYTGGIGPHRGLDTAIAGMSLVRREIANAKLVIGGSGSKDVMRQLKSQVNMLNLQHCVDFKGQLPYPEYRKAILSADVNIIPHNRNGHTDNTVPHKLFQMMTVNKPLLVSSSKPLARIVSEYDAGYIFEADNPHDFAQKVIEVYNRPEIAMAKAQRGKDAVVHSGLNWETESKKLIALYASKS